MRPTSLDEVLGQEDLMAEGAAFRTMVESGRPASMILWGPPGSGKTTLARLIAGHAQASLAALSATSSGVKDVRAVLADAIERLSENGERTVLFLDEIHRFTKAQQDALLPGVEDGTIILVGATTENPFFEVIAPLLSRTTLFRLTPLGEENIEILIEEALTADRGLGTTGLVIEEEARTALSIRSGGDARLALNTLEVAALLSQRVGKEKITTSEISEALSRRIIRYDKAGDQHYDVISAFIKSLRGSDPDAALYWLHTMLEAGEDPEFIARRMVILASEDVGLADSGALSVAVAAAQALQIVGLPEAAHNLTHAALYLGAAPKSNSVPKAMAAARRLVADTVVVDVPPHLRSTGYSGARALGHGQGYLYPHDFVDHRVRQQYLPDSVEGAVVYEPTSQGDEKEVGRRLADWRDRLSDQQDH